MDDQPPHEPLEPTPVDLEGLASGDDARRFLDLLYPELHRVAAACLRSERRNHTFQTTELLHEAYLRLAGNLPDGIKDQRHFFALAARCMRRILIDHARERAAAIHGGGAVFISLSLVEGEAAGDRDALELLALDAALTKLEEIDADSARIVTLRYFGGLTELETAAALGLGLRTVQKYWSWARAWIAGELGRGEAG